MSQTVTEPCEESECCLVLYPSDVIKRDCGNCEHAQNVTEVDPDTPEGEVGGREVDLECHIEPPDSGGWSKVKTTDAACEKFMASKTAIVRAKDRLGKVKKDLTE